MSFQIIWHNAKMNLFLLHSNKKNEYKTPKYGKSIVFFVGTFVSSVILFDPMQTVWKERGQRIGYCITITLPLKLNDSFFLRRCLALILQFFAIYFTFAIIRMSLLTSMAIEFGCAFVSTTHAHHLIAFSFNLISISNFYKFSFRFVFLFNFFPLCSMFFFTHSVSSSPFFFQANDF